MSRSEFLGEFEQVVLLAVACLRSGAYGVEIRNEIELRVGRSIATGSVYAVLDRKERKGYIHSVVGDPTPVRGGRAKRYYELLPAGATVLERSRRLLEGLWNDVDFEPERLT